MYGERGVLVTPSRVHASDQGAKCFSLDSSVALVICSYERGREVGGMGGREREGGGGREGEGGGGRGRVTCNNGP